MYHYICVVQLVEVQSLSFFATAKQVVYPSRFVGYCIVPVLSVLCMTDVSKCNFCEKALSDFNELAMFIGTMV